MLKDNLYDLAKGEPSVFDRELAKGGGWMGGMQSRARLDDAAAGCRGWAGGVSTVKTCILNESNEMR